MPALPQLAPPGRVWSYNNAGFALSGRLLEVVTGRPVHDALRELVFAPLGLTRTFTRLTEAMTFPVTLGHRDRDGATEVIRPFQTTSSTTAGGVLTSLSDLMRYARFHLGDVVRRAPPTCRPGAWRRCRRRRSASTGPTTRWGSAGTSAGSATRRRWRTAARSTATAC